MRVRFRNSTETMNTMVMVMTGVGTPATLPAPRNFQASVMQRMGLPSEYT